MMKLYLVQHGQASAKEVDPQRRLTLVGQQQSEKIAVFLKSKSIQIAEVWHSKKERAQQTARIFSQVLAIQSVRDRDDLNPLDPVEKLPHQIQSQSKDLMIVGHLPFLQRLVSQLCAVSQDCELIEFQYSGVICLEYRQRWQVAWMVTPDLIG